MKPSTLKIKRMEAGLTQWGLAKLVGISETHLSRIENGRCDVSDEILKRIAGVLKVAPEDLQAGIGNWNQGITTI
jgi:transcriptional regulator with XRE-family HTH domain